MTLYVADVLARVHFLSGLSLFVFAFTLMMNGIAVATAYEDRDKGDFFHMAWLALRIQAVLFFICLTAFIATPSRDVLQVMVEQDAIVEKKGQQP